jgi:hypothetical protein
MFDAICVVVWMIAVEVEECVEWRIRLLCSGGTGEDLYLCVVSLLTDMSLVDE